MFFKDLPPLENHYILFPILSIFFYVYFKYFILFYFYQTIFKQIQTKNLGANFGQIRINKYNTLYVSQF